MKANLHELLTEHTEEAVVSWKIKKPREMPEWLRIQLDYAEKTVASWSEGKREAAGISRETYESKYNRET